jgi:hypothetical protein
MIIGLLIPLFLIVISILVARKLFTRDDQGAPNSFSIRRLFQYLLLFGLLVISVTGVSGLIGRLFDTNQIILESRTELARNLTFVIIGIPLYYLVWRWTRKTLSENPTERKSVAWNSYLTVTSITSVGVIMTSAYDILNWVIGNERLNGFNLARFLTWGLVWIFHWQLIKATSSSENTRVHFIIGSLVGLTTLAFGLGGLISSIARLAIETDQKSLLIKSANPSIQAINLILIGLPVWYLYWLRNTLQATRELIWYSYVLLIGVAGGFLTLVISSSIFIYDTLVWTIGDPQKELASEHFDSSAGALGSAVVGLAIWWYHANVVNSPIVLTANRKTTPESATPEFRKSRDEVRRVYEYIISGISLIAAAAGLMMIIVAVIESITPGELISTTSSTNTLMVAFTLIIVGAPIWYYFWSRIESHLVIDGEEVTSPTRRIFLLMLFGVSAVAAVISILSGVFIFLDDLLNSQLGNETLREIRFAIAILASNAAIGWYHWSIYRQERSVGVRKPQVSKNIVLIGPRDEGLVRRLHEEFGGRVQMWQSLVTETPAITKSSSSQPKKSDDWDLQKVIEIVKATNSDEIMIIKESKGLRAIPFSRHD